MTSPKQAEPVTARMPWPTKPDNATVCGEPGSLATIVIVADFGPIDVGWKRIGSSRVEPQQSSIGNPLSEF